MPRAGGRRIRKTSMMLKRKMSINRRRKRSSPRALNNRGKSKAIRFAFFSPIQCPSDPKVSVVIPAMNEQKTISQVIYQARQVHESAEVIVVVNGSTDATERNARKMGARVFVYPKRLGHDVGRSIGAKEAKGDIILFVDGDFVIPAVDLIPLVKAVEKGLDIALNSYLGPVDKVHAHNVIVAKHALNLALSRPDLKGVSLTTIPHAMSRNALERIGITNLAVPPIAHAIAIHQGLKVSPVHLIHVGQKNPRRRRVAGQDPLEKLIVGDHLEAIHWLVQHTDKRASHTDLDRRRGAVREIECS